jgi:hypothetical protein
MASRANTYERRTAVIGATMRRINDDGRVSIKDCRREHSVPWGISCGECMYTLERNICVQDLDCIDTD